MDYNNLSSKTALELSQLTDAEIASLTPEMMLQIQARDLFSQNDWAYHFLRRLNSIQIKFLNLHLFAVEIWGFEQLPDSFYQALTPAQFLSLNVENFKNWDGRQLKALSNQKIWLSIEQIKEATKGRPGLFDQNDWSYLFLNNLETAQIQAIHPSQFKSFIWGFEYLSDFFYASITPEQISSIGTQNLSYWGAKQLSSLRRDQVRALSNEQLSEITNNKTNLFDQNIWAAEFLEKLSDDQIKSLNPLLFQGFIYGFEYLPDSFYQNLSTAQISNINPQNLYYWGTRQLSLLNSAQFQALTAKQIFAVTFNKFNLFNENNWATRFLAALDSSQIQAIEPVSFYSNIYGFEYLPKSFFTSLSAAQISYISHWNAGYTLASNLEGLSNEQVQAFNLQFIITLSEKRPELFIYENSATSFLRKLSHNQVYWINPAVFKNSISNFSDLSTTFFQSLNSEQIAAMNVLSLNNQGADLMLRVFRRDQIQALTFEQIASTKPDVMRTFSYHFFESLSLTQIPAIGAENIRTFDAGVMSAFSANQIKAFTPQQIEAFQLTTVKSMSEIQIAALSGDQLKAILGSSSLKSLLNIGGTWGSHYFGEWSALQIQAISIRAISSLESMIEFIPPQTLAKMNFSGIEHMLNKLSALQIAISTPKIKEIVAANRDVFNRNYWAASFLGKLYRSQIQGLDPNAFSGVIYGMEELSEYFYQSLTPVQLSCVNIENIRTWRASVLAFFNSKEQLWALGDKISEITPSAIRGLRSDLVLELAPSQIKKLTSGQFSAILSQPASANIALGINAGVQEVKTTWDISQLTSLSVDAILQMTREQISKLSSYAFNYIAGTSKYGLVLNSIDKNGAWTSDQFGGLNANVIKNLTIEQIKSLSSKHLQAILSNSSSAQVLIKLGESFAWTDEQFGALTTSALSGLTKEQIGNISVRQMQAIIRSPHGRSVWWGQWWNMDEGVAAPCWTEEQILSLSPQVWGSLDYQQLAEIAGKLHPWNPSENRPFWLPVQYFSPAALPALGSNVWSNLSLSVISEISAAQFQGAMVLTENFKNTFSDIGGLPPAWSIEQFKFLSNDVVKSLTSSQLRILSSNASAGKLFGQNSWAFNFLSQLNASQIQSIHPKVFNSFIFNFEHLSQDFYKSLTLEQLAQIGDVNLNKWTAHALTALSVEQVRALSSSQIGKLSSMPGKWLISFLEKLTASQIRGIDEGAFLTYTEGLEGLPISFFQSLTPKQIGNMHVRNVNLWGREIIRGLRVEQIQALSSEQINEFAKGSFTDKSVGIVNGKSFVFEGYEYANRWVADFLTKLSATQIKSIGSIGQIWDILNLPTEVMRALTPAQFKYLVEANNRDLATMSLRDIPASLVADLGRTIRYFSDDVISRLTNEQIANLSPETILAIINSPDLKKVFFNTVQWGRRDSENTYREVGWTGEQISHLSSAAINSLGENFSSFNSRAIANMNFIGVDPQIFNNLTEKQLTSFNPNFNINQLTAQQLKVILSRGDLASVIYRVGDAGSWSKDQISKLSSDAISGLGGNIVSFNDVAISSMNFAGVEGVLEKLAGSQISMLTFEQIAKISGEQFLKMLENPVLAVRIFFPGGVGSWSEAQIGKLSKEAIARIGEKIQHFSAKAIANIDLSGVDAATLASSLSMEQINALTPKQIQNLTALQLGAIMQTPNLAAVVANVGERGSWSEEQISSISSEGIQGMALAGKLPLLNSRAIRSMDMLKVDQVSIAGLSSLQLSWLTTEQIAKLTIHQLNSILIRPHLASVVRNLGSAISWTRQQFESLSSDVKKSVFPGAEEERNKLSKLSLDEIANLSSAYVNEIVADSRLSSVLTNVGAAGSWNNIQINRLSAQAIEGLGEFLKLFNSQAISWMNWSAPIDLNKVFKYINGEQLTIGTLALILHNKPDLFDQNDWASTFLGTLNGDQIKSLHPNVFSSRIWGLEYLPVSFYQSLTSEQISKISDFNLDYMRGEQLGSLSFSQISALLERRPNLFQDNDWAINSLKRLTESEIKKIPVRSLNVNIRSFVYLPTILLRALTPDQISWIAESNLEQWDGWQYGQLTDQQIQAMLPSQIGSVSNKPNLFRDNDWSAHFLSKLNARQIAAIHPSMFSVPIRNFENLPKAFFESLSGQQISAAPLEIFGALPLAVLKEFNGSQISALTAQQIIQIYSRQEFYRKTKLSVDPNYSWTAEQIASISASALNEMGRYIQIFNVAAVSSINFKDVDAQTMRLLSAEQLAVFTPRQISMLTNDQISGMLLNPALKAVMINVGSSESWTQIQFASLGKSMGDYFSWLQSMLEVYSNPSLALVGQITASRLIEIFETPPLAQLLTNVGNVGSWSAIQIGHLSSAAISGLGSHISRLNTLAIASLNFDNVNPVVLKYLSAEQLRAFTLRQISQLSGAQISAMLSKPELSKIIQSSGDAESWSIDGVAKLSSKTIGELSAEELNGFNRQSISSMDLFDVSPAIISQLSPEKIRGLTTTQLSKISAAQAREIFLKHSLRDIVVKVDEPNSWSRVQIQSLSIDAIQSFTYLFPNGGSGVINYLTKDQIKAIPIASISSIYIPNVNNNPLLDFTREMIRGLTAEQINQLDGNRFEILLRKNEAGKSIFTNIGDPNGWTKAQFQALSEAAIQRLSANDVASLNKSQILSLTSRQLAVISINGVSSWDREIVYKISPEVVAGLGQYLNRFDVNTISNMNLRMVDTQSIKSLTPNQILSLRVGQINLLSIDQLRSIISVPNLASVIFNVGGDQAWTKEQFESLPLDLINEALNSNNTFAINARALTLMTPDVIKSMSANQLNTLSPLALSQVMKVGEYGAFTEAQFNSISSKAFMGLGRTIFESIPSIYRDRKIAEALKLIVKGDTFSSGFISALNESQLVELISKVGINSFGPKEIGRISPSILSGTRNKLFMKQFESLEQYQLKNLTDEQIIAIESNLKWNVSARSNLKASIDQHDFKYSESQPNSTPVDDDIKSSIVISRNIFVQLTLMRAVWGSQHLNKQASINQALADYDNTLTKNNIRTTGRNNYQISRAVFGGMGSWGTVSSFLYAAGRTDNGAEKAKNATQGIAYFLSSLKPISSLVSLVYQLGAVGAYDAMSGKKLTLIELGNKFQVGADGSEELSRKALTIDDFNGLKSDDNYLIYQTSSKDGFGEVTHMYIQKVGKLPEGSISGGILDLQNKTKKALGLSAIDIAVSKPSLPIDGRSIYEDSLIRDQIERAERIKFSREVMQVQAVADLFSIANSATQIALGSKEGDEGIKNTTLHTLTIVTSTINLISDFYGPTTSASAIAIKRASTAFAVSNILTAVTSLTIATMDVINVSSDDALGDRVGKYGNLSATGFLVGLSVAAMIAPQFAPLVLAGSLLMPNFSSIGNAVDLAKKIDLYHSRGEHIYAEYILRPLYKLAIYNSTPLLNWFALAMNDIALRAIKGDMVEDGYRRIWLAIEQLHEYERMQTIDAKNTIQAVSQAIYQAGNMWDAVLISATQTSTSQYYVDDGQILTYASVLTIARGGSNRENTLEIIKASQLGVDRSQKEAPIAINFGLNDKRAAVNATVSGFDEVSTHLDFSEFSANSQSKLNIVEIQKNNVKVLGNSESQFILDLGMIKDISSIEIKIDRPTDKNNTITLMDASNSLSSLSYNLDWFYQESTGRSLIVKGLYSENIYTSFITGTRAKQTYIYSGGIDNVSMLGGDSSVTLGGAGSRLEMANGGNTATIELTAGELSRGAGIYNGGFTADPNKINTIDFSSTSEDDLFFIERASSFDEVLSWTNVYGFSRTIDSNQFDLALTSRKDALDTKTGYIDEGVFTNFDSLHTGSQSNYLSISGNTNISNIYLNGKISNIVDLNLSSVKSSANNHVLSIESSVVGSSIVNLGNAKLTSDKFDGISITGRGGNLEINTQNYLGDLDLELTNTGAFSTLLNDGLNEKSNAFINATILGSESGGAFSFKFSKWRSAYIEASRPDTSFIEIEEADYMADEARLIVNSTLSLAKMNFNEDGNRLLISSIEGAQKTFISLDYGSAANFDNITLTDAGMDKAGTFEVRMDALIQAMATIKSDRTFSTSYTAAQSNSYSGNDLYRVLYPARV